MGALWNLIKKAVRDVALLIEEEGERIERAAPSSKTIASLMRDLPEGARREFYDEPFSREIQDRLDAEGLRCWEGYCYKRGEPTLVVSKTKRQFGSTGR